MDLCFHLPSFIKCIGTKRSWKNSPDCSGYAACSVDFGVLPQHLNGKQDQKYQE